MARPEDAGAAVAVDDVPLHPLALPDAVQRIADAAEDQRPLAVHLCNSYTLSLAHRDGRLRDVLRRADLNLIDGTPLAWVVARRAGRTCRAVRGADLLRACLDEPRLRHYLLGCQGESDGDRLREYLREGHPAAKVVGLHVPPYPYDWEADLARVVDDVHASGANVIWVGLGTPKQDHLAAALAEQARLPVIPVGAAFDFLAGRVHEAPERLRGSGLEWAYRFAQEPRRLWRRYLRGNLDMLLIAARDGRCRDR